MAFDIDDALEMVGLCRTSKTSSFGSFLMGAGIGAAVGAGVAMLMTPYSGPESRERLVRAGDDLKNQISDKVQQVQGQIQDQVISLQHRIQGGDSARDGNTLPNGVASSTSI